ncbi:MAG TPA: DUF11 domain-containing protein, partial [Anaerolineales bacterium]|nr:DUF11 domain-containing protein [Anaerolineales bacterium]
PSVASGVVVTDTLPAGVVLVDADPSQGSCGASVPIQCDLGQLTAGAEATVTVEVTVASDAPDLLLNTAGVSGAEAESDTMNNAASAETTVFTLNWIEPVSEGETFDVGVGLLPLVVEVTDQLPIDQVVFERWDTNSLQWVPIGIGSPDTQNTLYTITVDTATLQYTWNQVRARATDEDGNVSLKPYIWIYRLFNKFMPIILK